MAHYQEQQNSLSIEIRNLGKVVASARCSRIGKDIRIQHLFVRARYRNKGLEEALLSQVIQYARKYEATKVICSCGAEPFCEDGQIPLTQEVEFYQAHGFFRDKAAFGICMIKELTYHDH